MTIRPILHYTAIKHVCCTPRNQLTYNNTSIMWEYRYEGAIVVEMPSGMQQPLSQFAIGRNRDTVSNQVVVVTNDG
jgi:hypothetical protein